MVLRHDTTRVVFHFILCRMIKNEKISTTRHSTLVVFRVAPCRSISFDSQKNSTRQDTETSLVPCRFSKPEHNLNIFFEPGRVVKQKKITNNFYLVSCREARKKNRIYFLCSAVKKEKLANILIFVFRVVLCRKERKNLTFFSCRVVS